MTAGESCLPLVALSTSEYTSSVICRWHWGRTLLRKGHRVVCFSDTGVPGDSINHTLVRQVLAQQPVAPQLHGIVILFAVFNFLRVRYRHLLASAIAKPLKSIR